MKITILTCHRCGKEKTIGFEDPDNLREYTFKREHQVCSECRKSDSPENQLLNALFGEDTRENLWDTNCSCQCKPKEQK